MECNKIDRLRVRLRAICGLALVRGFVRSRRPGARPARAGWPGAGLPGSAATGGGFRFLVGWRWAFWFKNRGEDAAPTEVIIRDRWSLL